MRTVGQVLSDRLPVLMGKRPTDVEAKALAMTIMETTGMLDWPVIEPPTPGGPCWVVRKEAVDALAARICENDSLTYDWDQLAEGERDGWRESALAVAAALLGNVRRAKAVGMFAFGIDSERTVAVSFSAKDSEGQYHGFCEGDPVAVLEDE